MPAPVIIPLQPKWPELPVFAGMNGCQLAELMARAAPAMNSNTTKTFTKTIRLLNEADSLMPMTSSTVTTKMMRTAGRLKIALTCESVAGSVPRALICSAKRAPNAVQPAFILSAAANAAGMSINSVPRAAESWGGTMIPKSEERNHVTRPPNRDRNGTDGILQDQVPAYDPGEQLA